MPLWYIMSTPRCKNIFRSALKLHLTSLKLIVVQYNSFIQTSKISKNHFFPSFPRPKFQNVINHKIFKILWCPLHRIFCTWYRLIKHINIDIWKNWLWLGLPIDGHILFSLPSFQFGSLEPGSTPIWLRKMAPASSGLTWAMQTFWISNTCLLIITHIISIYVGLEIQYGTLYTCWGEIFAVHIIYSYYSLDDAPPTI
jgi:hypothetical protein